MMQIDQAGLIEIASYEAIVLRPYREMLSTGNWDVWTWGVGHTKAAGDPDPALLPMDADQPMARVFQVLSADMASVQARVNQAVHVPISQTENNALCSFDFNTGGIFVAHLTALLNQGNHAAAADAFMGWSEPPDVIGRRKNEQALFRSGTYSSDGRALLVPVDALNRPLYREGKLVDVAGLLTGDSNG